MNKADMVSKLRDSTEAMRLAPSEVGHMIDMMADWGWLTLDDEPQPANAAIEGADAEPVITPVEIPAAEEEEVYDDSDDDDEETESESEHRELVTPRVHRTKVKTKTKTKATSTRRSHR